MSRGLPTPLFLLLCASAGVAGCADPNPTFVFDAAPAVAAKDGGTDASTTDGGQDAADASDASPDDAGGGQ